MPTETTKLPRYIERAITSPISRKLPYSWLTEEQWRDMAEHVYNDEIIVDKAMIESFLPRGTQYQFGRSIRKTLFGLLYSAIEGHKGRADVVPHYKEAEKIFNLFNAVGEVKSSGLDFSELLKELNYFF